MEKDITNSDAWLGKGIAIVYTSKIGDIKTTEAIAYWKNAIKHAANTEAMGKRVAKEINSVVNSFYPTMENHYINFHNLDNAYQELVGRFSILEKAQDFATQLDNNNIKYFETGYALCKRVIEIPKKYAVSDANSAMAGALIGGLQGDKYKQKDAISKSQKSRERKNEIENAAKIIHNIEAKYIEGIKKIDPTKKISSNSGVADPKDEALIELVTSKYKNISSIIGISSEIKTKYNISLTEANKLVRKVLLNHNLITQEELNIKDKKDNKAASIILLIILLVLFAAYFLNN